jgi:hypothetical protein
VKGKDFVPIRSVLRKLVADLEQQAGEAIQQVERVWREVVGEELAELTRVRAAGPRSVEIEAFGSAVLAEIEQFYRTRFEKKLKDEGISTIERVSYRLGDG